MAMATTSIRSTHDAFDWIVSLLNPAVDDGSVYWVEATSWAHDYWELKPQAGCWLRASIDNHSNEAYHLKLSCRGVWHGSLDNPEWRPVATAKVWTLANAGQLAGLVLMAAAEAGEDPSLVVPLHTPAEKHQNWDGRP
jgi:hypothetical protein